jgi:FkbM family methyltransferase
MRKMLLTLAKKIYMATPSRTIRGMYFEAFARLVRNRKAIVDIDGNIFDLDFGESIDLRLYLRRFEPEVAAALRMFARLGMTVLDIGANIGAHTLLLGSLVGDAGRVIAFEPTNFAWKKLVRNLSLNRMPWITAVNAALADCDENGRNIDFRASWRTDGGRNDREGVVDFIRLDDWCAHNGITKVDLVKIDIDGNEYAAFAGGRRILTESRPVIVMETVAPHFAHPATNPLRFLEALGYEFRDLSDGSTVSIKTVQRRLPAHDPGMTMSTNLLALPIGRQ